MGVDGLTGLDKIRTETANQVYASAAQIMLFCCLNDILCSVANPENSLFWLYPDVVKVMQQVQDCSTSFHDCMHGGRGKKLTKWWANKDAYEPLECLCDGKHEHAQWNPIQEVQGLRFPTLRKLPILTCFVKGFWIWWYSMRSKEAQHSQKR